MKIELLDEHEVKIIFTAEEWYGLQQLADQSDASLEGVIEEAVDFALDEVLGDVEPEDDSDLFEVDDICDGCSAPLSDCDCDEVEDE